MDINISTFKLIEFLDRVIYVSEIDLTSSDLKHVLDDRIMLHE